MTSTAALQGLQPAARIVALTCLTVAIGLGGALASAILRGASATAAGLSLSLVDVLAGLVPVVCLTVFRELTARRRSGSLRTALDSVVPPGLVPDILRDNGHARMAAEQRTITVLFADLEGFTGFAERTSPEQVARVITEYLSAMGSVIVSHGGTVDKFIGDAIMAFWNAPQTDPAHAQHACEAALDMQRRLAELNRGWQAEGLPTQGMRIGINTGPATVGYVGGPARVAYTALGSTVNIGSRLESLSSRRGASICIAQSTVEQLGVGAVSVRFLERRLVKGSHQPVVVYELVEDASMQAPAGQPLVPPAGTAHRLPVGSSLRVRTTTARRPSGSLLRTAARGEWAIC